MGESEYFTHNFLKTSLRGQVSCPLKPRIYSTERYDKKAGGQIKSQRAIGHLSPSRSVPLQVCASLLFAHIPSCFSAVLPGRQWEGPRGWSWCKEPGLLCKWSWIPAFSPQDTSGLGVGLTPFSIEMRATPTHAPVGILCEESPMDIFLL